MNRLYPDEKNLREASNNTNSKLVLDKEQSSKNIKGKGLASVLKPWMKIHGEQPPVLNATNFYDYFMRMIEAYPEDAIMLECEGKQYTRADIFQEVEKHVNRFLNLGIKKGDIVTFMMLNVPEVIFMFLALNKIGAIANLIKFDETPKRINYLLNLTNSKYFFVTEAPFILENALKVLEINDNIKKIIPIPLTEFLKEQTKEEAVNYHNERVMNYATYKENYSQPVNLSNEELTLDDSTLIVYTGGSTGDPKGVELTNRNLIAMGHGMKYSNFGYDAGKSSMNILPPAIAYYMNATLGLMICGLKVILIPNFDIPKYDELVDKHKANFYFAGPILLKILQNSKIEDFSYITNLISGGDKLYDSEELEIDAAMAKKGAPPCRQGYGSNEVTAEATCSPAHFKKVGSIGIPMVNVVVGIFDYRTDKELPLGQQGEICITGDTVMKGYYNNPEATDFVKIRHSDGLDWIHTDDFGVMDEDGFLFHKGRAKRMMTRSGSKVWLPLLEEEVAKLGLVVDCCATVLKDEVESEVPILHVSLEDGQELDTETIDAHIREHLPSTYLPKYYVIQDSIPYTGTNRKKDFKTLEAENILDTDNYQIGERIIRKRSKVMKKLPKKD